MSRVPKAAVATTVLLSGLDGYDVRSVTFAAPALSREWGIGKSELGILLSAGLVGMAFGSFLLAPLADIVGRRFLANASLLVMASGSAGCAFAGTIEALAAWRILTGLEIAACIAVITPVAAEFSNKRSRPLAMALMARGSSVGGLLGGLPAAALMSAYGWPGVFEAGAVAAIALLAITIGLLSESPSFLVFRDRPDSRQRLDHLLKQCGLPAHIDAFPGRISRRGYAGVFAGHQIAVTARLAMVNMLVAAASYLILSWFPKLVGDVGFSAPVASLVSAVLSLAGIGGGVVVTLAATRIGQARSTGLAIVGLGFSIAVVGSTSSSLASFLAAAALRGACLFGSAAGFYGVLAGGYNDVDRASGSGFVIGTGRISSAIAPLLAGYCFAADFSRSKVSIAFGLAAAALLFDHSRRGAR